ncbi:MAG TPA: HAMP domain-containing sensor histidine kinase [Polyangiales bacterium]
MSEENGQLQAELARLRAECESLRGQVGRLHRAKTTMDLLAGVAHDLAAALTGVVWCTQALHRRLELHDPELAEGLSDFQAAVHFAQQLARRLVSISHQPQAEFGYCRLADVMREAISLLETLRPPKLRLDVEYPAGDVWLLASSEQLQQVLLNLVANAFAASEASGGTVQVQTVDHVELPSGIASAAEHGWVRVRVRDDGHGMEDATLQLAFEPFFTTKAETDGSGLGLHVVRSVVEGHGGFVFAESALGVGTTFDVYLPRAVVRDQDDREAIRHDAP